MNRWCGVLRIGGIGDNLMASSVLPLLKQRYDRIEVISKAPCHEVFLNNPFIDKLVVWPEDDAPTDAVSFQLKLQDKAREFEPEAFFDLSYTCETALAYMRGQSEFWRPAAVRRKFSDQSYLARVHDACGMPHEFAPNFFPTEAEETQAWDTIGQIRSAMVGPIVGWCLSGSRVDKIYPFTHLAVARLISELGCSVVLFAAPNKRDINMAKEIRDHVRTVNGSEMGLHLAQKDWLPVTEEDQANPPAPTWPIRRCLSLIQKCDLVVSPDTGPAWAVAMRDMPKIVLHSHATPKNIMTGWVNTLALHCNPAEVPCWPCHRLHDDLSTCVKARDVEAAACMAGIPVGVIADAVRRILAA